MDHGPFDNLFLSLTGNPPLSWQRRLYQKWAANEPTHIIDLPTGLGKTMVMAIWLIARANKLDVPTRLIYVVDRRTVVDQATDLAVKLRDNCRQALSIEPPAISTLRGQLADNREWSRDPSKPAIIIGTVDLIGSALLFSGYRSSYKRRPLEAGLLGQDSLLVLDEAHLSKPFEKLLVGRKRDNGTHENGIEQFQRKLGAPMKVICMSATTAGGDKIRFKLEDTDLSDHIVKERFEATKVLRVKDPVEKKEANDSLAQAAIEIARSLSPRGTRIVVFVREPDDAKIVAQTIRDYEVKSEEWNGNKSKTVKTTPYSDSVQVLTGTMRGLERDELLTKYVLHRFLDGNEAPFDCPNQRPVFLVSTSAGEVGFDLNGDHLVGDEAPLDSWIQRLGRVNRRGNGRATVILVKKNQLANKTDFDKACIASSKLFTDGMDVSPKALAAFKRTLTPKQIDEASSPKPTTVELTDILLDAWSMTSITKPMPGRPDVGPWLRGIENDQAQTTIAWRAELELFQDVAKPEKALQSIFSKHPIRPHESLTVNTGYLLDFLKQLPKLKDRPSSLTSTRVAVRLARGQVVCRTIEELTGNRGILYSECTLIFPATFGGLDSSGMLDTESVAKERKEGEPEPKSFDVADEPGYEQTDKARSRLRILIKRTEAGWTALALPGGQSIPADVQLSPPYGKTTPLFEAFKKARFRVRLREDIKFDNEDAAVESLVILAPAPKKQEKEDQALDAHVGAVEAHANHIAAALGLQGAFRDSFLFAAKWHDEGKKAHVWQTFANGPMPDRQPKGKTSQARDPKSLKHYRHEFGSILRIHHQDRFERIECVLPEDDATRNLALHLIATHHGAGRPHFPVAVYDKFSDEERDALHTESIRRFAKLQRKYGWWYLAWLENLLRCADALASADEEVTEIDELEEGAE